MTYSARKQVEVENGVFVREMTALQFADASEALTDIATKSPREKFAAMALVCQLSCCDAEGEPIYASVDAVLGETFAWLEQCCEAALRVNGLTETPAGK